MTVPSEEPALRLLDYLDPASIHTGLAPRGKHETLRALADFARARGLVHDGDALMDAVLRREEVVSTGVGNGIAIPHADLPEIESPSLVLGIIPDGVDFDALDEEPVYVVFLLLGTPRSPGLHMRILARIARLSKRVEFCRHLRKAQTAEGAYRALRELEGGNDGVKLLLFHLNREEKLDEILAGFVEIGITGATVIDSVGMGQVLSREVPIFAGFQSLLSGARPYNKTIFSVVEDSKVDRALRLIEEVCGSFDAPGGGIAYVLNLEQAHGLKPEIG